MNKNIHPFLSRNSILILTSLFFLFIYCSCADINRNGQQQKIGAMNIYLDSIEKIILNDKNDSLSKMTQKSTDVELRIKNYLISDTIDLALGKKMDDYKIMRKKNWLFKKKQICFKKSD